MTSELGPFSLGASTLGSRDFLVTEGETLPSSDSLIFNDFENESLAMSDNVTFIIVVGESLGAADSTSFSISIQTQSLALSESIQLMSTDSESLSISDSDFPSLGVSESLGASDISNSFSFTTLGEDIGFIDRTLLSAIAAETISTIERIGLSLRASESSSLIDTARSFSLIVPGLLSFDEKIVLGVDSKETSSFSDDTSFVDKVNEPLPSLDSVENDLIHTEGESSSIADAYSLALSPEEVLNPSDESGLMVSDSETLALLDEEMALSLLLDNEMMDLLEAYISFLIHYDNENVGATDYVVFPAYAYSGVIGRISLPLDLTKQEFCDSVLESGNLISLNGTPALAFIFPIQAAQRFNEQITSYAGDAIMFSCPDLVVANGNQVLHDGILYVIKTIKDAMISGNIIFRKSFLGRIDPMTSMPKPLGLIASDNLSKSSTLTWDPIDNKIWNHYDSFFVYRMKADLPAKSYDANFMLLNTPPTSTYLGLTCIVGPSPTGDFVGHENEKAVWGGAAWAFSAPADNTIIYTLDLNEFYQYDLAGDLWEVLTWELVDRTPSNSYVDRNIESATKYTYVLRIRDIYGHFGPYSEYFTCGLGP